MRTPRLRSLPPIAALIVTLVGAGCSGDGDATSSGGPIEAGDGKFRPPGNGMPMGEADACNTLTTAQAMRLQFLGCAGTTRTCPELLRVEFGESCLQYDQGSVQGCVDYYTEKKNCTNLVKGIGDCSVTPLTGTAPKGCP